MKGRTSLLIWFDFLRERKFYEKEKREEGSSANNSYYGQSFMVGLKKGE
jgi:hypothetical protein